jgi:hypothetical protein
MLFKLLGALAELRLKTVGRVGYWTGFGGVDSVEIQGLVCHEDVDSVLIAQD